MFRSLVLMAFLCAAGASVSYGTVAAPAEPGSGQETLEVLSLMANAMLIPMNISYATENGHKWLGAAGLALGLTTSIVASNVEVDSDLSTVVVVAGAMGGVAGLLSLARTANPKDSVTKHSLVPTVSVSGARAPRVGLRWSF